MKKKSTLFSVVVKFGCRDIDFVDLTENVTHGGVDLPSFLGGLLRQQGVLENSALDIVHDVEGRTKHTAM